MVDQRRKTYIKTTPMGHEVAVTKLAMEDTEQELAEFEVKHAMTTEEFAEVHGLKGLAIPSYGISQEWKFHDIRDEITAHLKRLN